MRHLLPGILFILSASCLAATPERFDQTAFEKRFKAADKAKKGRLSRAEAYAEFPRMPEFFDEIDRNKDGFITIAEVNQAMERRVNAAMGSGQSASAYAGPTSPGAPNQAPTSQAPQFSSKEEARRQQRYDYYESLAGSLESSRLQGTPTQPEPYPTPLKKSF